MVLWIARVMGAADSVAVLSSPAPPGAPRRQLRAPPGCGSIPGERRRPGVRGSPPILSGTPPLEQFFLRSAGAQGQQCVRPLGKVPALATEPESKNPSGAPGSRGILGLRPRVGSAIRFLQGRRMATWARLREGPKEKGRAIPVHTVPRFLSGRATPRVPCLSNSRSRSSQDLGVKVRRKKSYHVSTFQWAGLPPPPIHYLLRRPGGGQSTHTDRPVRRASGPMGIAAGIPHVAARPSSVSRPILSTSNGDA